MWSRITGKSQDKAEDAHSQTSRRKEEGRSSGRHRSESMVSSTSARKPPRGDDRDRGFNPTTTSYSSTSRSPYPGTAAASVASSYATASSNQADVPLIPPDLVRNDSLANQTPRRDQDRHGQSHRRRVRSSSRDRDAEKTKRTRSRDRAGAKQERREKRDSKNEKDRGLSRSESGYQDDKGRTRAQSTSANGSGGFSAQVESSGFTQFPGQYDGDMPGFPSAPSHPQPTMSTHVQDQFPGQFPTESTAPYRPPVPASEGGPGLAAEYYGDAGESVAHQPGVRPQAPSLIVGAEPHLQPASSVAAPPLEPSATGGVGAAASFFSGSDDFQSLPPATASKPGSDPRPMNSNQPGRSNSGTFASTGSIALGYATGSHHQTAGSQSTMGYSNASTQKPASHLPPGPSYPLPSVPTSSSYHSSSAPVIPTLGAAVAGAAAGYAIGNHSSSHHQDHVASHVTGSSYASRTSADPHRPPLHTQVSQGSFPAGGETFIEGKPPSYSSNTPSYAAGVAGVAGLATAAYHNKHHISMQSSYTTQQYPSGSMAQKHRQHGPLDKLVDFWKDPYGVARFEEYTEYIGVCKYCFAPGSSPRDAPRKHHYRRRGSNERFGSSIRIDKESRYWSSDGENRRRKGKSWLATGLAGYGMSKISKSLFATNDDSEDIKTIRSGHLNKSKASLHGRHHSSSPDRRSYISRDVTRRASTVGSSHRNHSQQRIETGITSDGKVHRKDPRGDSSIKTYDTRPHSRSRSRSDGRRSGLAEAAIGVAVGSSIMAAKSRKRSQSPKKVSTRPTHRSREHNPEPASAFSAGHSQSKPTGNYSYYSPTSSYTDVRRSRLSPEPGILGGFFSSPSEKPRHSHRKNKKKKGFFNFGNSSSSSTDFDLAFGSGVDRFQNKKQPKTRDKKNSSNNSNSALLGLGAAAAILAANETRKNNNGKRKVDVVAVKESKGTYGRRSEHDSKGTLISGPSGVDEDPWESASEDDVASVDYALAYGGLRRKSQESLRSDSSGTSKWNWRWGSKKKRREASPRESQSVPSAGIAGALVGAAAGAALSARDHHQETAWSNTSSLPPLQHVHPIPTSDPSHFDVVRQNSMGLDSWPITTSRPAPIPLQQPQPMPLISPAVYTTPVSYGHSYSAPAGPPVFSQVLQQPVPLLPDAQPVTYRNQLPETVPGSSLNGDHQPGARSNEVVYHVKSEQQGFAPALISNMSSGSKRTTNREDTAGVRFDLTLERKDKERRVHEDKEYRDQENKERTDSENSERRDRDKKDRRDRPRQRRDDGDARRREGEQREAEHQAEIEDQRRLKKVSELTAEEKVRRAEEIDQELERLVRKIPSSEPTKSSSWPLPALAGVAGAVIGATIVDRAIDNIEEQNDSRRKQQGWDNDQESADLGEVEDSSALRSERELRARQEAKIARQAATRVRQAPTPEHENYAEFFNPHYLHGEKSHVGPEAESASSSDQAPHIVTIEPPLSRETSDEIQRKDSPLPWHLPKINMTLQLTQPTPPTSFAGSARNSPLIRPEDAKESDYEDPQRSRTGSKVSFGDSETREYNIVTPLDQRGEFIEPTSLEHDVQDDQAQRGVGAESGIPVYEKVVPIEVQRLDHVPGEFSDDIDFAATVAAGLEDTGFDPSIVIDDPGFRRRDSPPGSEQFRFYQSPFFDTAQSLSLDSPGTEGAPPVRGFIEGELPPTPKEEIAPAAFKEVGDESSAEVNLEKRGKKEKKKGMKRQSTDQPKNTSDGFATPSQQAKVFDDRRQYSPEQDLPSLSKRETSDDLETFIKPKKSKSKKPKRGTTRSDPVSPGVTPVQDMSRDDFFDIPKLPAKKPEDMQLQNLEVIASGVPLPEDNADDLGSPSIISGKGSGTALVEDRDTYDFASDEEADSVVASAPMPGNFEEPKKSKKKSKRRTSDYDEVASSVSSPAAFDNTTQPNGKTKKDIKGSLFGLFNKSTDDVSKKTRSKDTPKEATFEIVEESKRKGKKSKDRRSTNDDDDVRSRASEPVADLSRPIDDDFEEPKKKSKKSKDRKSRYDEDDTPSLASEPAPALPVFDDEDKAEDRKSRRSRNKEEKRRSRQDDTIGEDSGRITQDLPAEVYMPASPGRPLPILSQESLTNPEDPNFKDTENKNKPQTYEFNRDTDRSIMIADENQPLSFLGVRQEMERPPNDVDTSLHYKSVQINTDITDLPKLELIKDVLPPLPESRPTSPIEVGKLEDLPPLPLSRSTSPTTTPSGHRRHLSMLQLSDASHPGASPSPTAVPLIFRRPPSAGFSRSSPSTPAVPSQSAATFTPRQRQPRPSSTEFKTSTEFRPLWLVERHSTRQIAPLNEVYPSLPSSHSTSRASSVHDAEDLDPFDHVEPGSNELDMSAERGLTIDTHWNTRSDFLDSQQATPTAASFQFKELAHKETQSGQAPFYQNDLRDILAGDSLEAEQIHELPQRITHSVDDFFPDLRSKSPSRYDVESHEELPALPSSRATSPYDLHSAEDSLSTTEDIVTATLTDGAMLRSPRSDSYSQKQPIPDNHINHASGSNINFSNKELEQTVSSMQVGREREIFVSTIGKKKKDKNQRKDNKVLQAQDKPRTTRSPSISAVANFDVKPLSLEERQKIEEQDVQDAVDSWLAPNTPKKTRKGKKGKNKEKVVDIPEISNESLIPTNVTDEFGAVFNPISTSKEPILTSDEASRATMVEQAGSTKSGYVDAQLAEEETTRTGSPTKDVLTVEAVAVMAASAASAAVSLAGSLNPSALATQAKDNDQQGFVSTSEKAKKRNGKDTGPNLAGQVFAEATPIDPVQLLLSERSTGRDVPLEDLPHSSSLTTQVEDGSRQDLLSSSNSQEPENKDPAFELQPSLEDNPQPSSASGLSQAVNNPSTAPGQFLIEDNQSPMKISGFYSPNPKKSKKGEKKSAPLAAETGRGFESLANVSSSSEETVETQMYEQQVEESILSLEELKKAKKSRKITPWNYFEKPAISNPQERGPVEKSQSAISDLRSPTASEVAMSAGDQELKTKQAENPKAASPANLPTIFPEEIPLPHSDDVDLINTVLKSAAIDQDVAKVETAGVVISPTSLATPKEKPPSTPDILGLIDVPLEGSSTDPRVVNLEDSPAVILPIYRQNPTKVPLPNDDVSDVLPTQQLSLKEAALPNNGDLDSLPTLLASPKEIALPDDDDLDLLPSMAASPDDIALPDDGDLDLLPELPPSRAIDGNFADTKHPEVPIFTNSPTIPGDIASPDANNLDLFDRVPLVPRFEFQDTTEEEHTSRNAVTNLPERQDHVTSTGMDLFIPSVQLNEERNITEAPRRHAEGADPSIAAAPVPHTAEVSETPFFEAASSLPLESQDDSNGYFTLSMGKKAKKGRKGRQSQPVTPYAESVITREEFETPMEIPLADSSRELQVQVKDHADTATDNRPTQSVEEEWALPIKKNGKIGKKLKVVNKASSSSTSKFAQGASVPEQQDPKLLSDGFMKPSEEHLTLKELDHEPGKIHDKSLQTGETSSSSLRSLTALDNQLNPSGPVVDLATIMIKKDGPEEPAVDDDWGFSTKKKGKKGQKFKEVEARSVPNMLSDEQNVVEPSQIEAIINTTTGTRSIPDQESTPVVDATTYDEMIASQGQTWDMLSRKKGKKAKKGGQSRTIETKEPVVIETIQMTSLGQDTVSAKGLVVEDPEELGILTSKKNQKSKRKALLRSVSDGPSASNFPDQIQIIEQVHAPGDLPVGSATLDPKPVSEEIASQEYSRDIGMNSGIENLVTPTQVHSPTILAPKDKSPDRTEEALIEHQAHRVEQTQLGLQPTLKPREDEVLEEAKMMALPTDDLHDFLTDHRTNHEGLEDPTTVGTGKSPDVSSMPEHEPTVRFRTSENTDDMIFYEATRVALPPDDSEQLREDPSLQKEVTTSGTPNADVGAIVMAGQGLLPKLRGIKTQEDVILDEASKAELPPDDADSCLVDESVPYTSVIDSSTLNSPEIGPSHVPKSLPGYLDFESQEATVLEEAKNALLPPDNADAYMGNEESQYTAAAASSNRGGYDTEIQSNHDEGTQPAVRHIKSRQNFLLEETRNSISPPDNIEETSEDHITRHNTIPDSADDETAPDKIAINEGFRQSQQGIIPLIHGEESMEKSLEEDILCEAVAVALPADDVNESYEHQLEPPTVFPPGHGPDALAPWGDSFSVESRTMPPEENTLFDETVATNLPPDAGDESLEAKLALDGSRTADEPRIIDGQGMLDEPRTIDELGQVQSRDFPAKLAKKLKKARNPKTPAWDEDFASIGSEEHSPLKFDPTLSEIVIVSSSPQPYAESPRPVSRGIEASTEGISETPKSQKDKKKSKKAQAFNWEHDAEIILPHELPTASASVPTPGLPTHEPSLIEHESQNEGDCRAFDESTAPSEETIPQMTMGTLGDDEPYPSIKVKKDKKKGKRAQALKWDGGAEPTTPQESPATTALLLPPTLERNLDIPYVPAEMTGGLGNNDSERKGKRNKEKGKKSQVLSLEDGVRALTHQESSTAELDSPNLEASQEIAYLPGNGNPAQITISSEDSNILGTGSAGPTMAPIQEKKAIEVNIVTEPDIALKEGTTAVFGDPSIPAKEYPEFPEIEIPDSPFIATRDGDSADAASFNLNRNKKDKKSKKVPTFDPSEEPDVAVKGDTSRPAQNYSEFPEIELSDSENFIRTVDKPAEFLMFDSKKSKKSKKGKKTQASGTDDDFGVVKADSAGAEETNIIIKDLGKAPEKVEPTFDVFDTFGSKKGRKDKRGAKKTQITDWIEEPETVLPEEVTKRSPETVANEPANLQESGITHTDISQEVATKSGDEGSFRLKKGKKDKKKAKKALLPFEEEESSRQLLASPETEVPRATSPDIPQTSGLAQVMSENLLAHEILQEPEVSQEPEPSPEPEVLQEPADLSPDWVLEPAVIPHDLAGIVPQQVKTPAVESAFAEHPGKTSMGVPHLVANLQDQASPIFNNSAHINEALNRGGTFSQTLQDDILLRQTKADFHSDVREDTIRSALAVKDETETLPENNPFLEGPNTTRGLLDQQPIISPIDETRTTVKETQDSALGIGDAPLSSKGFTGPTNHAEALDPTRNSKARCVAIDSRIKDDASVVPEPISDDQFVGFTSKKKGKKIKKKGQQEIPLDIGRVEDSGSSTPLETFPSVEESKPMPAASLVPDIIQAEPIGSKDKPRDPTEEVPLVHDSVRSLPEYQEDSAIVQQEPLLKAEEQILTGDIEHRAKETDNLPVPDEFSAFSMGTRKKGKKSKKQKPLVGEDNIVTPPAVAESSQAEVIGTPGLLPASETQQTSYPSLQQHSFEEVCAPSLKEPLQSQESVAIKQNQGLESSDLNRERIQDISKEHQITSKQQSSEIEGFQGPSIPTDVEPEHQDYDMSRGDPQIAQVSSPGYIGDLDEERGIIQKNGEAFDDSWAFPITKSKKSKQKQKEPLAVIETMRTNHIRSPDPDFKGIKDQTSLIPRIPPAETLIEAVHLPQEPAIDNRLSGLVQYKDQGLSTVVEPKDSWDLPITKKGQKSKKAKRQPLDLGFTTESGDLPLNEDTTQTEHYSFNLPTIDASDSRNDPEVDMVQPPPTIRSSADPNVKANDEVFPSRTTIKESEPRTSKGFSGRARATSAVGAGIALFEGLQRTDSIPKGKKSKKERKGSQQADWDEPNLEPSSKVKGETSQEVATLDNALQKQDPDNGPKDTRVPSDHSFEQPSSLETSAFQSTDLDKSAYRDSGVHVVDSPVLQEGSPVYHSVRDSGYQGTEESPTIGVAFQGHEQETDKPEVRPSNDDIPRQVPYGIVPSHIIEGHHTSDTNRSSMAESSENPLNISIEVDPAYDVSISRPERGRSQTRRESIVQAEEYEKVGHEEEQHPSTHPELPFGSPRQPSPVDSTTKDRSSILFQSSPSTREEGVDYAATFQPLSPRQAYDQGEPRAVPTFPAESSQSLQDNSPKGIEGDLREVKPVSLFGGPIGINSDLPTSTFTPLDSESSHRGKLNTIIEHSPEESPLREKSRDISDAELPDYGARATRRSATPQSLSHHRVRSPQASDTRDKGPLSTDDILSRLSWPAVDEENHSVDLDRNLSRNENSERRASSRQSNVSTLAIDPHKHPESERRSFSGASIRSGESIHAIIRTPDQIRSASGLSNRSSGTPPLRRVDRSVSGDLRAANKRSEAKKTAKRAEADNAPRAEAEAEPHVAIPSSSTYDPVTDKGKKPISVMADVYEGWGDVHGSPRSPTRPPSMRRRQSMQILDLETRLDQLVSENRLLQDAKSRAERNVDDAVHDHSQEKNALTEALQTRDLYLKQKDSELSELKEILEGLHHEVSQLTEVNEGLTGARKEFAAEHQQRYDQLAAEHTETYRQLQESTRGFAELKQKHTHVSTGVEGIVRHEVNMAIESKNVELRQLRDDLLSAREQVRLLQQQILASKPSKDLLTSRDEDYFDSQCQQLCQHVQQWVLRFSKFSDMRACRHTSEVSDEKVIDRFDNAILDGSDVDLFLADRIKRRDVFMSVVMTMVWEYVFTRYLFGMDREQRQKLKSLEKTLSEVGPMKAVNKWRATTLVMLSRRDAFLSQRAQDTEAVVQEIFRTLSLFLPPPLNLVNQIQESLRNVMRAAVDLSVEMRTQKAEYIMLPPLQPEYDTNGDLARKVYFTASLMNERSGDTISNEELAAQQAVVRMVLFPLVVKKGDDQGVGDEEIVVCPAQVLVAKENEGRGNNKSVRVISATGDRMEGLSTGNRSVQSFAPSSMEPGLGGMI